MPLSIGLFCSSIGLFCSLIGDCGIVEECLKKHSPVVSQHEDSWLTKTLKLHIKSAMAVPLDCSHHSKVVLMCYLSLLLLMFSNSTVHPTPRWCYQSTEFIMPGPLWSSAHELALSSASLLLSTRWARWTDLGLPTSTPWRHCQRRWRGRWTTIRTSMNSSSSRRKCYTRHTFSNVPSLY
jgi:hypothetical protein